MVPTKYRAPPVTVIIVCSNPEARDGSRQRFYPTLSNPQCATEKREGSNEIDLKSGGVGLNVVVFWRVAERLAPWGIF